MIRCFFCVRRVSFGLTIALVLSVACDGAGETASSNEPSTVIVSAAASLSDAIEEISDRFEAEREIRILLNLAGSQVLATQIIEGAPVDLFISADSRQLERVIDSGRVDVGLQVDLLSNQLVVVVPSDRSESINDLEDLMHPLIRRISIGDPESVPVGVYAKRYLKSVGLWESLFEKLVPATNARAALRAVESGEVTAGIVYRTDGLSSSDVIVKLDVPIESASPIVYPAAVIADGSNASDAHRFLNYLCSQSAQVIFEAAGFIFLSHCSNQLR